jgi:FkbM family methyltransferase
MKQLVADGLASLINSGLTLLRNRSELSLTREEFRASRVCFSLFGEDLAVTRWLARFPFAPKIYVDAGCNEPVQNSNTLLLYKAGWRGVNIDMSPEHIASFNRLRPDDINVVAALGSEAQTMKIFSYGETPTATDRLGAEKFIDLKSIENEEPARTRLVTTTTLNMVLAQSPFEQISYLNIDCEGYDFEVLKGIDLDRYRPLVITIEARGDEVPPVTAYLNGMGYELKEILEITLLFVRRDVLDAACGSRIAPQ